MNNFINKEILIEAYRHGAFPMAPSADSETVEWLYPHMRGILPLNKFHIPRRLKEHLKQNPFQITINQSFHEVMKSCAAPAPGRTETWINEPIFNVFTELHYDGHAHSLECWDNENNLVGGIYGLHIGSVFFGESMFSHVTNASKIALCYMSALLKSNNFALFDVQFMTDHLRQFGGLEIPHEEYLQLLGSAIIQKNPLDPIKLSGKDVINILEDQKRDG